MEIYKQVTKDKDIVNISTLSNLKFEFWKDDNKKELEKEIQADINLSLKAMQLMPDFNNLITLYEIKWDKSMRDFNAMECEIITREFQRIYRHKIERLARV